MSNSGHYNRKHAERAKPTNPAKARRLARGQIKAWDRDRFHHQCEHRDAYGRHLTTPTEPLCLACSKRLHRWF